MDIMLIKTIPEAAVEISNALFLTRCKIKTVTCILKTVLTSDFDKLTNHN